MADRSLAISLSNLKFAYGRGKTILDIPSFSVERGEKLFLFGPSGSGKTTLLGILAGVLTGYSGTVEVEGTNLAQLSGSQRDAFRGENLGYIFQLFNLIPYLSVTENITLPCRLHPKRAKRVPPTPGAASASLEAAAQELAGRLGLQEFLQRKVTELSVGQQQRVAAARALLGAPPLLIADEPTSSLDFDHREKFLQLLFANTQRSGATVLFVSHDRSLMNLFDRVVNLDEINQAAQPAEVA